jgi:hypothetical protein
MAETSRLRELRESAVSSARSALGGFAQRRRLKHGELHLISLSQFEMNAFRLL